MAGVWQWGGGHLPGTSEALGSAAGRVGEEEQSNRDAASAQFVSQQISSLLPVGSEPLTPHSGRGRGVGSFMFSTRCDVSAVADWGAGWEGSGKLGSPAPSKLCRVSWLPADFPPCWKALFFSKTSVVAGEMAQWLGCSLPSLATGV